MSRAFTILGSTFGLGIGTLALLLAALSIYLDRWDSVALYGAATFACLAFVAWVLRRDRRARRERGELPAARVPRQPIRMPLLGTAVTFVLWYVLAVAVMGALDRGLFFFDYAVVAPFAAFMLTVLTFAGRHIAFRLTAEEARERERGR